MAQNKVLQVTIMTAIVTLLVIVVGKIPSTYEVLGFTLYLQLVIPLIWIIIIFFSVALISLGFSQIPKLNEKMQKKFEEVYNTFYGLSFKIIAGILLLAVSFNAANIATPFVKSMDDSVMVIFLMLLIMILIIKFLESRGIKLTQNED